MDIFKTEAGTHSAIPITYENYYEATKNKPPFVQNTAKGPAHYAICPICDNPIRMYALYNRESAKVKPHARHRRRDVAGLADYDDDAYLACPLANPSAKGDDLKRTETSETGLALKRLMREQFDRMIYIFEKSAGIHFGADAAHDALLSWRHAQGWRNYDANYFNLPFMLFFGTSHKLLYRWIVKGSQIDMALRNEKALARAEVHNPHSDSSRYVQYKPAPGCTKHIELTFSFYKHESRVEDEHWHECFWLDVDLDGKSILREKIPVDHEILKRLEAIPQDKQRRNVKLLDIARNVLFMNDA